MHRFHYDELMHLIGLSNIAINELNNTINLILANPVCQMVTGAYEINTNLVWHHINGILMYTARISKMLWGSSDSKQSQARGKYLRESLGVSEDSLFHHQHRNVRNDYDHIDERLDDIEAGKLKMGPSDKNIGDICSFFTSKKAIDFIRHYDYCSQMIYFGKSTLSIIDLRAELNKLEKKVSEAIENL